MPNIENLNNENGSELINISEPATIRNYFLKVRELKKYGNEFPVNLDDVYPLIYSERGKAVRALKSNFIENEDFVLVAQNGKQRGGHNKVDYFLSVSAMEFFVAKKVKEIFNVYREVFHKTIDEKEESTMLSQLQQLLVVVQASVEHEKKITQIENNQVLLNNKVDYLFKEREENMNDLRSLPFNIEPGKLPELSLRDKVRSIVNKLSNNFRCQQSDVWNKIYEKLYYNYHISIKSYKKQKGEKSYLEVAERIGCLDKIFVLASNLADEFLNKPSFTR